MYEPSEQSNSISIGFAPLEMRYTKSTTDLVKKQQDYDQQYEQINQQINSLNHRLITRISIISPIQLKSSSYYKQLKTYRYQRKPHTPNHFGNYSVDQERQSSELFEVFKSLYNQWRLNTSRKFYITMSNGDLFYFFHKSASHSSPKNKHSKQGGSYCIISCQKTTFSKNLSEYSISYENLTRVRQQNQRLLLKNSAIQLFWRYILNYFMNQTQIGLLIISNYSFRQSNETYPLELYNGRQQRQIYQNVARKQQNLIGQFFKVLYCMKIHGYWFCQNLNELKDKLNQDIRSQGRHYKLEYVMHSATQGFTEQCSNL